MPLCRSPSGRPAGRFLGWTPAATARTLARWPGREHDGSAPAQTLEERGSTPRRPQSLYGPCLTRTPRAAAHAESRSRLHVPARRTPIADFPRILPLAARRLLPRSPVEVVQLPCLGRAGRRALHSRTPAPLLSEDRGLPLFNRPPAYSLSKAPALLKTAPLPCLPHLEYPMPWAPNGKRRDELPSNWQALRLRVLRRDRYTCQHRDDRNVLDCGTRANQVDHIARGNDHSETNLQALCQAHHAAKSSLEGIEAREARGYSARRPSRHPGKLD